MPVLALRVDGVDVLVTVAAEHTVADLSAALAVRAGHPGPVDLVHVVGAQTCSVDPVAPVGSSGLVSGSVVRLMPAGTGLSGSEARDDGGGLVVDVIGGPDTGRSYRLVGPDRYTIGRAISGPTDGVAIQLTDPSVSRRHATLIVRDEGVVVLDPEWRAVNGVEVGGVEITAPTVLSEHDIIRLGSTRLVVRDVRARSRSKRAAGLDVRPGPYRPARIEPLPLGQFGPIPDRPEPRRPPVVSVLAPLALGLVMFAVFGHLQFLLLVLVSPMVLVASVAEDRRSGRRSMRRRVAAFEEELATHCERLSAAREAERRTRHAAAPDLADLIRRSTDRSSALWQRRLTSPDALVVRVGVGTAAVSHVVEVASGGAGDLRHRALEAVSGFATVDDVPVTVDLRSQEVVAVRGPVDAVDGLVAAVLVQVVTLHGPDEFPVAAAFAPDRPFDWIDWLPHVRRSGFDDRRVARTTTETLSLLDRIVDAIGARVSHPPHPANSASSSIPASPLLVVLDASLDLDPIVVSRFLDAVAGTGVVVVVAVAEDGDVPRQARTVISVSASSGEGRWADMWTLQHGPGASRFEPETIRPELADAMARALAPLIDASGPRRAAAVPESVTLFDVVSSDAGLSDAGLVDAAGIVGRWSQHGARRTVGLDVPIGCAADGRVVLDLVADGPHALIAGTSGSGKSELLQSLVVSLAAHHPPDRVNVLLVDYKGGAMSAVLEALPHVVGTVSNLTPGLAERVLVSLRAELERRMAVLHGRAPDLAHLLLSDPDLAPPSLVVVVDEFATLAAEIPEFVTGMVDIAQRGRSLGIHLILATQRPSGSVTEDILANTGLRIGLRMLDPVESLAVLGVPAAAGLRGCGRAIVRRGTGRLVEFQAAHCGASLSNEPPRITVEKLRGHVQPIDRSPAPRAEGTQLGRVVEAINEAAALVGFEAPFRPWCDALPDVVELGPLLRTDRILGHRGEVGWPVVIGLLDEPESQRQRTAIVDLDGGMLVIGSRGSGVSTVVRTLISASAAGPIGAEVIVIDGRSAGLADVVGTPGVVDVIPATDLEALTRWIVALESELDRRRRAVDAGHGVSPDRLLVVLHGFEGVIGSLIDGGSRNGSSGWGGETWAERLVRIVVDGRSVGISSVVTAGRRGEIPVRVESAVTTRLVLRTSDVSSWADHGLMREEFRDLVPGRGHLLGPAGPPVLVQVATTVGSSIADRSRAGLTGRVPRLRTHRLPDQIDRVVGHGAGVRRAGVRSSSEPVLLGVADVSGDPVVVDLAGSDFVVCGPPGSGRTTALALIASQLADPAAVSVWLLGHPAGRLGELLGRPGIGVVRGDQLRSGDWLRSDAGRPGVLVIDDEGSVDAGRCAELDGMRLVAAVDQRSMAGYSANPVVARLRRSRRLLVLMPDDPTEFLQVTGFRSPIRPGLALRPGRAVLVVDRVPTVLQVMMPTWPPDDPSVQSA